MGFLDKITVYYLVITFLISLYLLAIPTYGLEKILLQAAPPLLAALATDVLLNYLKRKVWIKPVTAIISGLIIGLVGQFGESPLILAIIASSAMIFKFFIRWEGRHIFNPAAGGLFLGLILGSYPSWWAGGASAWPFLIWIPILLYKLKRWAPIVGFLLPTVIFQGPHSLGSSSLLFFISIMLIEPKTSPFDVKVGLIYGLIVALAYLTLNYLDPLILALLIGNLIHSILRLRSGLRIKTEWN